MTAVPKEPPSTSTMADSLYDAGLASQVLLPSDPDYAGREDSYWCNDAKLGPACIVRPRSADEVSTALKALVSAGHQFAVRSGGHMSWAGANNIANGITIDLGLINHVNVDAASETVNIGPGGRWRDVYHELHKHNYTVAGGREANVGVGGFLLGGGLAFLNSQRGFACDDIISYEVVLADGSIVTADKDHHARLFRALKGGSNNFGIVTNFRMNMLSNNKIWGGLTISPKEYISSSIDAMHNFTTKVKDNPTETVWTLLMHSPELGDIKDTVIATAYASMVGTEKAPAFKEFLDIPTTISQLGIKTVSEFTVEYTQSTHHHVIWFTCAFKNDKRIMAKASELHDILVEDLKGVVPDENFITQNCEIMHTPKCRPGTERYRSSRKPSLTG
ncbi:hypothetical protein KVR01_011744 [Diaporthe batatas]|uniref:uncharacterized protein n=1 Tax=Diaporthe batatas TaxID=748121 RepID=UPI001D03BB98|nr:uncharacterized protein KVR01_011744 [Diaporthe batatas]KAG8158622.1 hypothetical protein KVR01_011744 [Diaporthe batatas]